MKPNKEILIVGGTGFIGYHLAKRCIKEGWKVTSISTNKPKKTRYLKQIRYLICDITKKNFLSRQLRDNFSYVVNLGGYVDHINKTKTYKAHFL